MNIIFSEMSLIRFIDLTQLSMKIIYRIMFLINVAYMNLLNLHLMAIALLSLHTGKLAVARLILWQELKINWARKDGYQIIMMDLYLEV